MGKISRLDLSGANATWKSNPRGNFEIWIVCILAHFDSKYDLIVDGCRDQSDDDWVQS